MEHLTNCHGEWLYLAQALGAIPFIGYWLRAKFWPKHTHKGQN